MDVNIEDLKTEDGKIDFDKVEALIQEKPIIEVVSRDEQLEMSVKLNRDPYDVFPSRLPTEDKMPLPIDEHKHIGAYESKQNLYLTIAHAYNRLMEKVEALEEEVALLKK